MQKLRRQKMSKILLVDDEINAINGLKVIIDFKKLEIDTVLTAKNAFEALSLIENEKPEYIITDISMPQMTGLEMITEIKKIAKYSPKIVVLSGFSTFSYAQEALALGVRSYLLKPIDDDELNDILFKLYSEPDENNSELEKVIAESVMVKVLNGDATHKSLHHIESFIDLKLDSCIMLCPSKIGYKSAKELELSDEEIALNNEKFINIIVKMVSSEAVVSTFEITDTEILFLLHGQNLNIKSVKAKIEQGQKLAFSNLSIISSVVVSDSFKGIENITKTYRDCRNSILQISSTSKPQTVLQSEETISSEDFKIIYNLFGELSTNFETIKEEELSEKLNNIFKIAKEIDMPLSYFWSIFNAFIINITKYVAELDRDVETIIDKLANIKNQQFNLLSTNESKLHDLVFELFTEMNTHKIHQQHEVFHNIITYVNNNYPENLTLKSLATKFYVNPIYLGRLFKKNTGTFFNEYLTELRIDKSRLLLLKTNKKVYEIADEIGFNDPNYFIAKFLKAEGTTPSQYRKKQNS